MVDSNKILTVSYGTFSCTLEGFDDAFTTMKAIAEYFRDLAADDRYFGAEPPTPDPELLAKLASRSAARRVEARHDDNGIVLRQDQSALSAPQEADQEDGEIAKDDGQDPTPHSAETPEQSAKTLTDTADADADFANATDQDSPTLAAPAETNPVAEAGESDGADDSVVDDATLPASEAADDTAQPIDVANVEADVESPVETSEEPHTPVSAAPIARPVKARSIQVAAPSARRTPRVETRDPAKIARRPVATQTTVVTSKTDPTRLNRKPQATTARPISELTSVAAKLQRIRDVVTKNRATDTDFSEDQHAEEGAVDHDEAILGNISDADNAPIAQDISPDLDPSIDASIDDAVAAIGKQFDGDQQNDAGEDTGQVRDFALDEEEEAVIADEADDDDEDEYLDAAFDGSSDNWMAQDDDYEDEDDIDLSAALAIANAPEDNTGSDDAGLDDTDALDHDAHAPGDDPSFTPQDEVTDEAIANLGDDDAMQSATPVAPEAETAPQKPARPIARVLKVKRRDFEAALDDGTLEDDDQAFNFAPQTAAPPASAYGDSSLSPEDEAELQHELKALEDEIAGEDGATSPQAFATSDADVLDDDNVNAFTEDEQESTLSEEVAADFAEWEEDEAHFDDAPYQAAAPINPRQRLMDRSDGDMDRILAETNHQLGDSDGTRRRSAIAHLRAAVAATKAEKEAGVDLDDDLQEKADAYRDDLAQVVRPRRPAPRGDAPSRRREGRPAPLKLVAEQRVDLPDATSSEPVRPRRVRVADLAKREEEAERAKDTGDLPTDEMAHDAEAHARAAAANAASFTEFADRVGAYGMPDILEAAASYLAFVEGRDEFSRPQLMGKARQAMADDFSREDGLRHFGRLLREGKLRKVAAGQFSVSDRINFRPEERIAG